MGMTFTNEEQEDLTIPEDMLLRAQLVEIKAKEINWTDKQSGEARTKTLLEWWWEITADGKWRGRKIKGECDARLTSHPQNRFRNWAETLLNREIPIGMGIDTDDIVGLSAEISIRHEPDKKDPAKFYERLDEVLPVSGESFALSDEPPF